MSEHNVSFTWGVDEAGIKHSPANCALQKLMVEEAARLRWDGTKVSDPYLDRLDGSGCINYLLSVVRDFEGGGRVPLDRLKFCTQHHEHVGGWKKYMIGKGPLRMQ